MIILGKRTGTYNVLKLSIKTKIKRFVYLIPSCYGIPKQYPTKETSSIEPQYPYALTKRLGEELVLHFAKVYKLNASSLDFLMFMDQELELRGHMSGIWSVSCSKIAKKPFTIVGNGEQTRDFTLYPTL